MTNDTSIPTQEDKSRAKFWRPRVRWLAFLLLVIGFLLLMRKVPVAHLLEQLETWIVELGYWGPLVFGMVYVLAVLLFIPASALTVGAGALFSLTFGVMIVSLASTLAVALAFLITRYALRDAVFNRIGANVKFQAIDRAISESGWKIVAMLRLSPAVPYNLQNYLYGLTGIRFVTCVLTSWVAMLPGTILYVYIGYTARAGLEAASGNRSFSVMEWVFLIVGMLATVLVTIYITSMARQALRQATPMDKSITENTVDGEPPVESGWSVGTILLIVFSVVIFVSGVVLQFWAPQF